jgi:hypothetical protein
MATKNVQNTVGDFVVLQRGNTYSGKLVGEFGPALLGLGSIEPGGGFRHGKYKCFGGECPPKIIPVASLARQNSRGQRVRLYGLGFGS